ncbi:MAG: hypothetical protein ACP5JJ_12525, partial [Anaerolineae bacterium]
MKGSLHNTEDGCSFALRNIVDRGTVTRIGKLEIDGESHSPGGLQICTPDGSTLSADQVTPHAPLFVPQDVAITLRLPELHLAPGSHHLRLSIQTQEVGDLTFDITDELRAGPAANAAEVDDPGQTSLTQIEVQALDPGRRGRDLKVAIMGAGSAVFARQLITDLLCTPGLDRGTFALVDVDGERLELAHRIAEKLVEHSGRAWTVVSATERRKVLPGCDYVISAIEVAGLRNVRSDYEIPIKYGVDQCIGDTIGPGGIFKMLRTGPAWLDILRDAEQMCPQAIVMNYTNPMSALTLLGLRATRLAIVGLCHSVQSTTRQLAGYLDVPREELVYRCAGINHMAWFLELTHRGDDLYPRLREAARDPEIYECDPVRFE